MVNRNDTTLVLPTGKLAGLVHNVSSKTIEDNREDQK